MKLNNHQLERFIKCTSGSIFHSVLKIVGLNLLSNQM